MNTSDAFLRIWTAFDAGDILPACAWCGRVRIDDTWLLPSRAALAAIDQRYTLSHSICDGCADMIRRTQSSANGPQPNTAHHGNNTPSAEGRRKPGSGARSGACVERKVDGLVEGEL